MQQSRVHQAGVASGSGALDHFATMRVDNVVVDSACKVAIGPKFCVSTVMEQFPLICLVYNSNIEEKSRKNSD